MTNIYIAPDIRTQKIEDVEAFIDRKRVRRMVMAATHQQTIKEKAVKLHGKSAVAFQKQVALFDNAMEKLIDQIEKLQERAEKLSAIHSEMNNLEGVINDQA